MRSRFKGYFPVSADKAKLSEMQYCEKVSLEGFTILDGSWRDLIVNCHTSFSKMLDDFRGNALLKVNQGDPQNPTFELICAVSPKHKNHSVWYEFFSNQERATAEKRKAMGITQGIRQLLDSHTNNFLSK